MKPNAKKRSANKSGAVLVTAVVVLLIMSILMTATIGHVAVNRRKTNSNYSRKQAYLTASTTLKSFVAEIHDLTSAPSKKGDDAATAKQIANINALRQIALLPEPDNRVKVTYNGNKDEDGTGYKLGTTELEIKPDGEGTDKLIITAYTTYGGETEKVAAHISTEVFKEPAKFTNTIEEISYKGMKLNNLKVVGDTAILDDTDKFKTYKFINDVDLQGSLFIWGSVSSGTANPSFRLHQNLRNKSIGSFVQISENFYGRLLSSSNIDRVDGYNYIYVNGTTYSGDAQIGTSAHEVDLITHGVDQRRPSEVSESDWSQGDWKVYGNIYCYNSDPKLNPEGRKGDFIAARPNITVNGSVYIEGDLDLEATNVAKFTVTKELHVKGEIKGKSKIHCSTIKEGSEAEINKKGRGKEPTMEYKAEDYKYMPEDFFMNNDGVSSDTFRTKYLSFYDSTKDLDMFDDFKGYTTDEGAKFNYYLDSGKELGGGKIQNCYYIQSSTANKISPSDAKNAADVPVGSSRTVLVDVTDKSGDVVIMMKNGTTIDANNPVEIVVRNLSELKDVKDTDTGKMTKQHTYNCYFVSDSGDKIKFTGKNDKGVSQHTGSQKGFFDVTKFYVYDYDTYIKMFNPTYYSDSNRNIAKCGDNINPNFYYNPTSDTSLNGNKGGKTVYGPGYSGIIFLVGEGFDFGPSYKGGEPSDASSWEKHLGIDNNGGFLQISFYGPQSTFGINCQGLKLKIIDSTGDLYNVGDTSALGVGVFVASVVNAGQASYFYYTEPSHTSILTNAKGEKSKEISGFTLDRYDHY